MQLALQLCHANVFITPLPGEFFSKIKDFRWWFINFSNIRLKMESSDIGR